MTSQNSSGHIDDIAVFAWEMKLHQNSLSLFNIGDDHYDGMAELHRRIAPSCLSPSVNWHLALWPNPNFRANSTTEKQDDERRLWLESVNEFLAALENALTSDGDSNSLQIELDGNESDTKKSRFLMINGENFTWKVKVEVHFEYVTVTVFLHAATQKSDSREAGFSKNWPSFLKLLSPEDVAGALATVVEGGRDGWGDADEQKYQKRKEKTNLAATLLYDSIWDAVSLEVARRMGASGTQPGDLFADFRSIVVDSNLKNDDVEPGEKQASRTMSEFKNVIDTINEGSSFKEYIGCSMLNHKCIYVSTLGSRDDGEFRKTSASNSVRFIIINIAESEKWQVGRLLERIHSLGVARLAALKDLSRLREIGRRVQAMGLELDDITRDARPNLPLVENFLEKLNLLGTEGIEVNERDKASKILDGASYRIARSKYYGRLISTRLDDLRIKRIEGWQPYDEFLRRRLFPTLGFIQSIGKRIVALRNRVHSAISLVETRQTRVQLDAIKEIQKTIRDTEEETKQNIVIQNMMIKSQDKLNLRVTILTVITVIIGVLQLAAALKWL